MPMGVCGVPGSDAAPKRLVRIEKGSNPPETCKAEYYEPPPDRMPDVVGSGGIEVDGRGVAWQNWRVSGHFSSFDRSLCDNVSDPQAIGQSCPEGWSYQRKDDPTYDDSFYHANESYLAHMDFHNTLELGDDAPIYGSVNTDAMEVLSPNTGEYVTLRVPYPLGVLPPIGKRSDRRSQRGLEGERTLGELLDLRDVAHRGGHGRGRTGCPPEGGEVPDAARSSGKVGDRVTAVEHAAAGQF